MDQDKGFREGVGFAFRLGTELIVATFIGAIMGYALDRFLDTRPWFLAAGVLFGGAAGCLNVYQSATQELREPEEKNNNDSKKE